jgi:dodecin
MAVAKVIEIIAGSKSGFDDAVKQGLARANETIGSITGAWVKDQSVVCTDGKATEFRVTMKVTFLLNAPKASAKASAKASPKRSKK